MAGIGILIDSRENDLWRRVEAVRTDDRPFPSAPTTVSLLRNPPIDRPVSIDHALLRDVPFIERRPLPVGDVWFVERRPPDSQERILMIWERKTIPDLWSSLRDGRYYEQHDRVIRFAERLPEKIVYLRVLEGACPPPSSKYPCIPADTLFHIALKIYPDEGIGLRVQTVRTFHIQETMLLLQAVWKDLQPRPSTTATATEQGGGGSTSTEEKTGENLFRSLTHSKHIAPHRQDGVDARFLLAGALALIPRLSFSAALRIADAFQSIGNFTACYGQDSEGWRSRITQAIGRTSDRLLDRIQSLYFPRTPP